MRTTFLQQTFNMDNCLTKNKHQFSNPNLGMELLEAIAWEFGPQFQCFWCWGETEGLTVAVLGNQQKRKCVVEKNKKMQFSLAPKVGASSASSA